METRTDRLRKLADHLLNGKLGHEHFDFSHYTTGPRKTNGCGTAGCAIGECPVVFPNEWKFFDSVLPVYGDLKDEILSAMVFFGISKNEYSELFMPNSYPRVTNIHLGGYATKEQVANRIIKFCRIKEEGNE